jgi:hypothetical protein
MVPAKQDMTNVQDRIQHLENMVKELLSNQSTDHHTLTSDSSPLAVMTDSAANDGFTQSPAPSAPKASLGKLTTGKDQPNFVGSEHWESILEDIAELKIDLTTPDELERTDFKPQLLFGKNSASRLEIMSSIPPRPVCDLLISRWFKTFDMAPSK